MERTNGAKFVGCRGSARIGPRPGLGPLSPGSPYFGSQNLKANLHMQLVIELKNNFLIVYMLHTGLAVTPPSLSLVLPAGGLIL